MYSIPSQSHKRRERPNMSESRAANSEDRLRSNDREQPASVDPVSKGWLLLLYGEGGENRIGQEYPEMRPGTTERKNQHDGEN